MGETGIVAVCHQTYSWEHHRGYPLVFLARNAYDVVVSAYFHLTSEKAEYRVDELAKEPLRIRAP